MTKRTLSSTIATSKMSNYPEVKDSYFSRKSTEWNIIGFLDESKEASFEQKLDSYIKDLKIIANTEQGKRQEKAQLLIDNYKASRDSGIDRQRAKEWKEWKERHRTASGPTVNFHSSKVIGVGIGTLNGIRTLNVERTSVGS
ncbi:hypothetical protein BC937DRAFT_91820 [Endogone sp. FLAS-F59071]|nr:hypothetical protein BC937DRAFT_91820 [Endogone sp. FLAS-F59071]|eukprot:RUS15906.1 hypothetical protein BC937DRAFT_91820 [Endogone sp. FLAS-F59071]